MATYHVTSKHPARPALDAALEQLASAITTLRNMPDEPTTEGVLLSVSAAYDQLHGLLYKSRSPWLLSGCRRSRQPRVH